MWLEHLEYLRTEEDAQLEARRLARVNGERAISQEALDQAHAIVDAKVEAGELVRLTGGRIVTAAEYDPEKHGPKDCGHTEMCDHLS